MSNHTFASRVHCSDIVSFVPNNTGIFLVGTIPKSPINPLHQMAEIPMWNFVMDLIQAGIQEAYLLLSARTSIMVMHLSVM